MYKKNPFNLSFGRKPNEYIDRFTEVDEVINMFTELPVTDQIFILMGVRGSGKTVAMTDISDKISRNDDWIVIKISPIDNILDALFKILIRNSKVHQICIDAKIDFSFFGFNISVNNSMPEPNLINAIDKILETLQKKNIKLLVTIDEVTDTMQMRSFISAFQLYITNNRLIFFLGTALFEEIEKLQNVKNLTFLYRAPKIILSQLNTGAIANTYARIFECDRAAALNMAAMTKGYPLAFQLLGYVTWEHRNEAFLSDNILNEFDHRIADAAYIKLWSELSDNDRTVIISIANAETDTVREIRELSSMDANKFNQYRRRLNERGLIDASRYGHISFALPRFKEFVQYQSCF